jgi:SAM-dependent methyltransferase
MPLSVIEAVTRTNFCEQGYVLYNKDIENYVTGRGSARKHFNAYGVNEDRQQISSDFLGKNGDIYRRGKYERFREILELDGSTRPHYMGDADSFPMALTDRYLSTSDYSAESANPGYGPFDTELEANPDKNYMDIGCGLRSRVYENCLYVEVYPSVTADVVVAPDCSYPIKSNSLDGIGCFAVLEHVTKPWEMVVEIERMLKPGGVCFVDWPFLQPLHGYPSHYFNATRQGLELLFSEGFDILQLRTERSQTPDHAIQWLLGKFVRDLPEKKRKMVMEMSLAAFLEAPPGGDFWANILDGLPDETISEFACGNTLIARKAM